jgi:polynucleotide 5'-hydroxyl-kinase GRC3/NOL9
MSSWRPYKLSYDSKGRDFAGIFVFGEAPATYPNALSTLLNGSIVSIIVVDDEATLEDHHVVEGEADEIPFFAATSHGYSKPLDPGSSKSIGLALIRSIDIEKKELLLLTPANVGDLEAESTVLAFGGVETPGWAYLEENHFRETRSDETQESLHLLTDESLEWPWVQRTEAGDDTGDARLGMQAWKTRRFRAAK